VTAGPFSLRFPLKFGILLLFSMKEIDKSVREASREVWKNAGYWLPWGILVVVLAAYIFFQVRGFSPAYLENDPDGYLFLAKRMALGQPLCVNTSDPFQYQAHMWVETAPGKVTSKYPPGYPALMAGAYRLAGDRGMFMVSPIMGGLALIGAWLLFRLWLKPFSAVMALLTLALVSHYSFYCAYLLTHATSLCLTTWGMYFLWCWMAQPRWYWGLAAGAALGASLTVRPTDALSVFPLAVAAGAGLWHGYRSGRIPWAGVIAMIASWGLFACLLAWYNFALFGDPTVTGYELSGEQNGFSLGYFLQHFTTLMNGLNHDFLPIFFPLGLMGMMLWGPTVERAMRLLWFVPLFITYASYYWVTDNWASLRFLFSALPVCIGSAYAILEKIPASRIARTVTLLVLLGIFFNLNLARLRDLALGYPIGHNPHETAQVAGTLAEQAPADAVIFAQNPVYYSLGQRAAYTVYELEIFSKREGVERFREPDPRKRETEPRRQPERTQRLRKFYEKATDQELRESERTIVNSGLKSGRSIFFILSARQYETEKQNLGPGYTWKTVEEWDMDLVMRDRPQHQRWGLYQISEASPHTTKGDS